MQKTNAPAKLKEVFANTQTDTKHGTCFCLSYGQFTLKQVVIIITFGTFNLTRDI